MKRLLMLLITAWLALPAHAHKASDAYLQLQSTAAGASLRLDVALRDLDVALDIPPPANVPARRPRSSATRL